MYNINGKMFYSHFGQPGKVAELFAELGVRFLEGYLLPPHAKLMARGLRQSAVVSEIDVGSFEGERMIWIRVEATDGS